MATSSGIQPHKATLAGSLKVESTLLAAVRAVVGTSGAGGEMAAIMTWERVLVLSPHTDDAELGAGGTIGRLTEGGSEIRWLTLSDCEESVPSGFEPDALRQEQVQSWACLGVQPDNASTLRFPVRRFDENRQEILQSLIDVGREFAPNLVLAPSPSDTHQDHGVVAAEAFRAFKRTTLLSYEIPWNQSSPVSNSFVHLSAAHVEKKLAALTSYRSQSTRPYFDRDFTVSQLRYHGVRAGTKYAEAFEVRMWHLD